MWDPSEGLQALFGIWSFNPIEAIVASGLGGGSLIYAPDGQLRLRDRWREVDWQETTARPYLERLTSTMAAVAEEMGGRLSLAPTRRLRRLITVHPLGGCPMATDSRRGVVDDHGETFGHPGLFIADGSVMPGPVGANPSLTIAALAESTPVVDDHQFTRRGHTSRIGRTISRETVRGSTRVETFGGHRRSRPAGPGSGPAARESLRRPLVPGLGGCRCFGESGQGLRQ